MTRTQELIKQFMRSIASGQPWSIELVLVKEGPTDFPSLNLRLSWRLKEYIGRRMFWGNPNRLRRPLSMVHGILSKHFKKAT